MQPDWLSNAYVIALEEGGPAVFVDSGADVEPLVAAVEAWGARPVALLRTHTHHDHVVERGRACRAGTRSPSSPSRASGSGTGSRCVASRRRGTPTSTSRSSSGTRLVATGDVLFRDAVGGGDLEQVRHSVMDVLLALPDATRVLPGHTEETTIGREREANPFIRVWSGAEPELGEPVRVGGRDATLVVWSPDYDGKGKAQVRFADDGTEAIVGGSRVERG